MTDNPKFMDQLQDAVDLMIARDMNEAIERCTAAVSDAPDRAEGYCILGMIAMQMEDAGRAIELVERAHKMDPNCQEYSDALSVIYAKSGKLADSLYYAKLSMTLEPNRELRHIIPEAFRNYHLALSAATPSPHYVNAYIHFSMHEYDKAVDSCQMQLRIEKRDFACFVLLGRSLAALGKYEQAVDACHAAAHINSSTPGLYECMGDSLMHLGRFEEGATCWQLAVSLSPDDYQLSASAVASLAYAPEGKWRDAGDDLKRLNELVCADVEQVDVDDLPSDPGKTKIRIGFISDGFWGSPDAGFLEAAIDVLDKNRFEVFGYQQNTYQDATTTRFKSLTDKWLAIFDLDDDTVANIIARDSVDVLVDACGDAQGRSLALFARRAAAVQVCWTGWPRGAGLETIDFQLVDEVTPDDDASFGDVAPRIQLNSGLVAFNADSVSLDVRQLRTSPVAETEIVTFGGICDLAKLTPSVARAWAQVLRATPGSRLLLGYVGFISLAVKTRAQELFSHFGLIDRVSFQHTPPEVAANFAFFGQVDIMLDTFPLSATVAACEALLVGIPVATLRSPRKTAVSAINVLHAADRAEWVAQSEEEFVRIASGLAMDSPRLSETRISLPDELRKSALCDIGAFAEAMEAAFVQMLKSRVTD